MDGRVQMGMRWPISLEVRSVMQILSFLSGQSGALGVRLSAGDVQRSTTHTTRDMSDDNEASSKRLHFRGLHNRSDSFLTFTKWPNREAGESHVIVW